MVYFEVDELEKGSVVVCKNGIYADVKFVYTGEKYEKRYAFFTGNSCKNGDPIVMFTRDDLMDDFEVVYQ